MNILNKLTVNYLKMNKKRTIVTIIGIILSGAMITAVATLAVSFQRFMLDVEIGYDGAWDAYFKEVKIEDIDTIKNDKRFSDIMIMSKVGMAENKYSNDEFLYIKAYDNKALENMKIKLIEGRLPKNENEIVLSKTFFDGKENEPKIGDTITLDIGKRMSDGYELIGQAKADNETFVKESKKTYLVCGKIDRPDFERGTDNYTAGVTFLDNENMIISSTVDVGIISKKAKNIYKDTEEIAEKLGMYEINALGEKVYNVKYNTYVLAYKGVNNNSGFNEMLYTVCGILIAVIMVGSILVIYNSFAISVSERKRQFGMLSSIGATKKQIKKSVICEGAILGMIGIPIGILSGIGGIGITLNVVNSLLKPMIREEALNWSLHLVVSWQAILIAVVLIALTIYLSVVIPAKRASKISPIEAIRGNNEIKVKSKKLRTPKFINKIFGIEGEIALKNLKRSRKKYRTTVISLMISIILFISVSGFVGYMYGGFDSMYESVDYDYSIFIYTNNSEESKRVARKTKERIESSENIDKLTIYDIGYANSIIPKNKLDSRMEKAKEEKSYIKDYIDDYEDKYHIGINVISLNDKQMKEYLRKVGLDKLENNEAILINYVDLLKTAQIEGSITNYKENELLEIETYATPDDKGEIKEENTQKLQYKLAKVTDQMPFGIKNTNYLKLILIVNENEINKLGNDVYTRMIFTAKNDKELKEELDNLEKEVGDISLNVQNVKEEMQSQRNLKMIINIFLYGFIALISAIGIANIFNTISTNLNLRRREFAMLKSIGMTDKGFKKMLDLECFFYGTKALLFGLPIGIGICYLINQGFGNLIEFAFSLPWNSIIISIIAVYLVVFITMLYSSSKIKKENIIDVLRDENI
ncbi:MAG: ABC transporter permease [Clostridia bacterium]|nr:ABC transporter permease [Clostridia bacterium]